MGKQKIAIDIDDVLAGTTAVLINEVNQKRGVNLSESHYKIEADYWGYYEKVWAHYNIDDTDLMKEFLDGLAVDQGHVLPLPGAKQAIDYLKYQYELIALTSRPDAMRNATELWLTQHFGEGTFTAVHFLDFGTRASKTKGAACVEMGASWLIDDNVDHCKTAEQNGVQSVLFGVYGWQGDKKSGMVRCETWAETQEYFEHAVA